MQLGNICVFYHSPIMGKPWQRPDLRSMLRKKPDIHIMVPDEIMTCYKFEINRPIIVDVIPPITPSVVGSLRLTW